MWLYIISIFTGLIGLWILVNQLFPWLVYDFRFIGWGLKNAIGMICYARRKSMISITTRLVEQAAEAGDTPFIIFEDKTFSYSQINNRSNQIARAFNDVGVQTNETIGVMMTNSPDFISMWFGISKVGGVPAFINYRLSSTSLIHCIKLSKCTKILISDDDFVLKAMKDIEPKLSDLNVTVYVNGDAVKSGKIRYRSIKTMADEKSEAETPTEWISHCKMKTHFCYMFTSGTTGLPKAAIIVQSRAWMGSKILGLHGITSQDITYTTLPLYHASAAIIGVLGTLQLGSTLLLGKKFSARTFWKECRKHNVTVVQYIGEILRYICNQPKSLDDKNHNVRMAIGNGLSPRVWDEFVERFGKGIVISEFYVSTEGNIGYYNITGLRHCVGMASPLLCALTGLAFIKYDFYNGEIVRDKNGRCVLTAIGEPGIPIRKITKLSPFFGYRGNEHLTDKAILTDVFKPGDRYFNSGDIMVRNIDYSVSFVDRIGDTFRWKGENVSTNEVGDITSKAPGIAETNVYGVKIPCAEGRAGMLVAVLKPDCLTLDCVAVYNYVCATLPPYARPIFIRIQKEMLMTETWKQVKVKLVKEGFDLKQTGGDPVYFMNASAKKYVLLTQELWNAINYGTFHL